MSRTREVNLLEGDVKGALLKMSIPLMGVAFISMTYNMVNMFWLERYNTGAVSAVGIVSSVSWIANSIALIGKVGTASWLAQSYGKHEYKKAVEYIENGISINILLAIIYSLAVFFGQELYLSLFTLTDEVHAFANQYLSIVSLGYIFTFLVPVFAMSYNSIGNSVTPFYVTIIGAVTNFVLCPILIFGFNLGIVGAALSTVIAQATILTIFIVTSKRSNSLISQVRIFRRPIAERAKEIIKLGIPAAITSSFMASISIVLNSFISSFGTLPIAVYTIGTQIESISYMTADGFAIAVTAFMGQNLGAKNYDRLIYGYKESMKVFGVIGALATILLVVFGGNLFSIFSPGNTEMIQAGAGFLGIMGWAEILMAWEIGTNGAFNGLGLTKYPAYISIIGNVLRIPISLLLMPTLGVVGIWVAITLSMSIKGILALSLFYYSYKTTDGFRNLKYRRQE